MTNIIAAFREFVNAPENTFLIHVQLGARVRTYFTGCILFRLLASEEVNKGYNQILSIYCRNMDIKACVVTVVMICTNA